MAHTLLLSGFNAGSNCKLFSLLLATVIVTSNVKIPRYGFVTPTPSWMLLWIFCRKRTYAKEDSLTFFKCDPLKFILLGFDCYCAVSW